MKPLSLEAGQAEHGTQGRLTAGHPAGSLRRETRPAVTRYAFGILVFAAALLLRVLLTPVLGESMPFVLFVFPIVATLWFGGAGPVMAGTLVSACGTVLFVLEPRGSLAVSDPALWWGTVFYLIGGASVTVIDRTILQAWRRAEHARDIAGVALQERDRELEQRREAEEALRASNALLERKVAERTADLTRANASLQASEASLAAVVDTAMEGIVSVDDEMRILRFNRAAEEIFGRTAGEVVGQGVETLMPERFREAHRARVEEFAAGGPDSHRRRQPLVLRGLRADGREFPMEASVSWAIVDGRRQYNAMVRDITEQELLREEHSHKQKLEALGTLAGGIAHDFNNSLMAISGNTELALRKLEEGQPADRHLAEVLKASARAADITKRVQAFSRQGPTRPEVVALQGPVGDAVQLLRAGLPARIELATHFDAEALAACVDPHQIEQVVISLVTNAADAIEDGGRIDVTLTTTNVGIDRPAALAALSPGRYACIEVRDDGSGIPADIAGRIFDPFFTTKPRGQASGLGLWVAHGIARGHRGTITLEATGREGSTFRVWLPLADNAALPRTQAPAAPARDGKARVLFVDDEEAIVEMATAALEEKGFRVIGYTLPEHALRDFLLMPDEFDAIVTDLSMPNISGFELAHHAHDARPELPVILMSGYLKPEDHELARNIGIREVLQKPARIEEISRALDSVLAPQRAAA